MIDARARSARPRSVRPLVLLVGFCHWIRTRTYPVPVACLAYTEKDNLQRVWAMIERVGVCMLTTKGKRGLRARPLEARPDRSSGVIWFVTDLRSSKEHEIDSDHEIGLVFIDATENAYLSITASANVLCDRALAASIWRATDNMWWEGPHDPNAGLLRVIPRTAELWDGPSSKTVTIFEFLRSQIIGTKPDLGENRKTTVDMH